MCDSLNMRPIQQALTFSEGMWSGCQAIDDSRVYSIKPSISPVLSSDTPILWHKFEGILTKSSRLGQDWKTHPF